MAPLVGTNCWRWVRGANAAWQTRRQRTSRTARSRHCARSRPVLLTRQDHITLARAIHTWCHHRSTRSLTEALRDLQRAGEAHSRRIDSTAIHHPHAGNSRRAAPGLGQRLGPVRDIQRVLAQVDPDPDRGDEEVAATGNVSEGTEAVSGSRGAPLPLAAEVVC